MVKPDEQHPCIYSPNTIRELLIDGMSLEDRWQLLKRPLSKMTFRSRNGYRLDNNPVTLVNI